jgi:hypothetical protein
MGFRLAVTVDRLVLLGEGLFEGSIPPFSI